MCDKQLFKHSKLGLAVVGLCSQHELNILCFLQARTQQAFELEQSKQQERLRRERAALERQSRNLAKLPSRKERAEIEALEAVVEQLHKDAKAKDARQKLTVERLRRQIVTLQVCFPSQDT
jgi:hypothetical protein